MDQTLCVFSYLSKKHNAELVFDPTVPSFDDAAFQRNNWDNTPFAGSIELILPNHPEERGIGFYLSAFVDSDHAGDAITRRSRTDFLAYINNALVQW